MRKSKAHQYRQAYNAGGGCAAGSPLILATNLVASPSDAPSVADTILGMANTVGLPQAVPATPALPAARRWRNSKPASSSRWSRSAALSRTDLTICGRRPNRRQRRAFSNPGALR